MQDAIHNLARVFGGEQFSHESKYHTPDGSQWIRISHSPVRDHKGQIIGAALVTHDVTEKRGQEEKLRDSDQKIRAMLESAREGFFMIGHDYSIQMMNAIGSLNIRALTGKEAKSGDNILEFITPERREAFKGTFERVMTGAAEETEFCVETNEGERWFQTNYFPVRADNNEIIAVCASSKDITEKKLVDNALAKIRAEREEYQYRLQSILDNTPLVVFVKDLEGRYLFVNRSFLELLRLRDEEVIGKTDFDITSGELATQYKKADDEVIRTLRSVESEETLSDEKGDRHILLTKFPLFDKKNTIYGVGGIATDYTEKVQYRQKLIAAKKKAEQAELLQEQFLANMSHEIRTPMNGIIGMTNILTGTSLSEEQKEFVNIIRQSSDNLLFLINDILDLSKIKSGKLALENIPFNLKQTLDATMAPFYIKTKEKDIDLRFAQDPAIPLELQGDPYRLNQIINNLLSNALKFTEKGEIKVSAELLRCTDIQASIRFSVSDSGIGIPDEKLATIFNSFEQASDSTTRKFGGTGLGLSITKQLIEMQAGKIEVASEPGKGTVFSVTIPYVYTKSGPGIETKKVEAKQDNSGLIGKRILIAEDNEINQKVIQHILRKAGIETVIGNNGREAVNYLEAGQKFDLVILDLQMPEMDGYQTATYIRKKLQLQIPIIAMTASALRNEKMKCFELGMNEYMAKPFSPAELFQQLRRFLLEQTASSTDRERPAGQDTSLYNLTLLHEMDDNEYLCDILQIFLDTTPLALKEIKEAVLYENWELVHKRAHKMKSSLGILQMNSMLALITTIEHSAKQETETEKIPALLHQVIELFELVRPIIETELKNAKTVNV
jgi:PAS domain S-box-containing protein